MPCVKILQIQENDKYEIGKLLTKGYNSDTCLIKSKRFMLIFTGNKNDDS